MLPWNEQKVPGQFHHFVLTTKTTQPSPGFFCQWFNNPQPGCTFDVILMSSVQNDKILSKLIFGQQQLVMVNYACGFNQSETGKYFEWIINGFIFTERFYVINKIIPRSGITSSSSCGRVTKGYFSGLLLIIRSNVILFMLREKSTWISFDNSRACSSKLQKEYKETKKHHR